VIPSLRERVANGAEAGQKNKIINNEFFKIQKKENIIQEREKNSNRERKWREYIHRE